MNSETTNIRLPKYDIDSSDPHRDCPPRNLCNSHPCRHTPCRDPDWLHDLEDMRSDPDFHRELWYCFWIPSRRENMSLEEWPMYEAKLQRCQRIRNKWRQIKAELSAFRANQTAQLRRLDQQRTRDIPEFASSATGSLE
jgi:hypothetical protein